MNDARKAPEQEPTTHFGFQDVPESQKADKVAEVFHSVASQVRPDERPACPCGMHRLWKRFTIDCPACARAERVLDHGRRHRRPDRASSPAWSARPARWCWPTSTTPCSRWAATACSTTAWPATSRCVQADAEALPFPDNHFDVVTIAFGLRNVTDKDKALRLHAARAQAGRPPAGAGILQAGQRRCSPSSTTSTPSSSCRLGAS